jgi:hypothetical protein
MNQKIAAKVGSAMGSASGGIQVANRSGMGVYDENDMAAREQDDGR